MLCMSVTSSCLSPCLVGHFLGLCLLSPVLVVLCPLLSCVSPGCLKCLLVVLCLLGVLVVRVVPGCPVSPWLSCSLSHVLHVVFPLVPFHVFPPSFVFPALCPVLVHVVVFPLGSVPCLVVWFLSLYVPLHFVSFHVPLHFVRPGPVPVPSLRSMFSFLPLYRLFQCTRFRVFPLSSMMRHLSRQCAHLSLVSLP